MSLRVRKSYAVLFMISIVMLGVLIFVQYSELFAFNEVRYEDGAVVSDTTLFNTVKGNNLFKVEFSEFADDLLANKKVLKVDIDYSLPDGIEVSFNDMKPVAVALTPDGLRGISAEEYVIPYEASDAGIDCPVLTGCNPGTLYHKISDGTVSLVIENLKRLCNGDRDCYLLLSNIDFSEDDYISVYIDGLRTEIIMYPGDLAQNIKAIEAFLNDYDPDLTQVKRLDLRSEGMIIAVNK